MTKVAPEVSVRAGRSCFGGDIILSREFFNPATKDYIHLEGHEVEDTGIFRIAKWVPEGNDGFGTQNDNLETAIRTMLNFVPPAGFVEAAIPKEYYT